MKDLFHYFGQSPRSDESASSLKENEVGSGPIQERSAVNKAISSDVLKCKTSSNNMNPEEELTERGPSDFVGKTKQTGKEKSSASDDEDFKVKGIPKSVKRKYKPRRKTNSEKVIPDSEPSQLSSKNEDVTSRYNYPIAPEEQTNTPQEETPVVNTSPDDSASQQKPKAAKNILNFFSPTKSTNNQLEHNKSKGDNTGPQSEGSTSDPKGESLTEFKEKMKPRKSASVKKSFQELEKDLNSVDNTPEVKKKKKNSVSKGKVSVSKLNTSDAQEKTENAGVLSNINIKSNVSNAFQRIMSKKLDSHSPTVSNSDSKDEEGLYSIYTEDNASFDVPKPVLKRKKRSRIESDTEDDDQIGVGSQNKKKAMEVDETATQEEPERKSLMNYFSKITKAEAEIQSQKVQFKVEALVHHSNGSPYKSKSKAESRSQQKNFKKRKSKQRNNENKIEWLGSEEVSVENKPAPMPEAEGAAELNLGEENTCQENETKSAEALEENSVNRAKRSLKLSFSDSKLSKVKRLKKASESPKNENYTAGSSQDTELQSDPLAISIPPVVAVELAESSILVTETPAKKLKQISLMDRFVRKPCNDSTSAKNGETAKDLNKTISLNNPVVKLERMSMSLLDTKKTPLKTKQKKSSSKSEQSKSTTQVVSGEEDALKSLPKEPFVKSPSEIVTPEVRLWKMRVCLTPKPETKERDSPVVSPITVDTGSEDDYDVQEVAIVKKTKENAKLTVSEVKEDPDKEVEIVYEEKDLNISSKAPAKLAPLFMRPRKLDPVMEQAKQKFLQSGVPEQVRKMIEVQKSKECTQVELFPLISHVTQLDKDLPWTPSEGQLTLKTEFPESDPLPSESLKMGDMTSCDPLGCEMAEVLSNCSTSLRRQKRRLAMKHVPAILSLIRAEDNNFEVIRNFKTLREKYRKVLDPETSAALASKLDNNGKRRSRSTRRSRGNNQNTNSPKPISNISNLLWTDKYRPSTSDAIVGNKTSVESLKRWLESLRKISQSGQVPVAKAKKSKKHDHEDDFVLSDDNCDSNSNGAFLSNSALLVGCHASGKTNCVYALAADLGYKVLEINASERRSGKIILAKLSEATKSHQVANRSQEQNSATAKFLNPKLKASKRKIEKKRDSGEESTPNKLSLILIKDIDVVFEEEDEGFVSAVASLVSTSKRPVIFTTTNGDCPNVRKIVNSSTELFEFIPDKKALCSWLQTIALVEGVYISRGALETLFSTCRQDVRQTLLQLQVWMSTGGNHLLEPTVAKKNDSVQIQEESYLEEFLLTNITEEDLNADVTRSSLTVFEHHDCVGALQGRNDFELGKENKRVTIPSPVPFGLVWWNVPHFLCLPQVEVPKLVLPEVLEQPRRFKGLFDDSIFDMASDDEEMTNSLPTDSQPSNSQLGNSQLTDSVEDHVPPVENAVEPVESGSALTRAFDVERCTQEEVDAMLSHMQAMSTCDLILTASNLHENADDFEPIPRYWRVLPRDSLSQSIPTREGPNLFVEDVSRSMCHWLAENSIQHARSVLEVISQPERFNTLLPNHEIERRRVILADAESAALRIVAPCVQLERSAIALDYLTTLRRISALEQRRSERNTSRRNRFYHYFKSLSMDITPDQTMILSST